MTKHYCRNLLLLVFMIFIGINSLEAKAQAYSDVFQLGNFSTTITSRSMLIEEQVISFRGKINFNYNITPDVSWTIKNTLTNVIVAFGSGDSLLRHVFEVPGNYQIDIQEPHNHDPDECSHAHLPERINVKVSHVRMIYDLNTLVLSKEIVGGQEVDGTILTVNAFVEIFNGIPVTYPFTTFQSAGVETTIVGHITVPNKVLINGLNQFQFNLTGQARSSTYIMFDLLDFNGLTQCYYLLNQIK